MNNVWTHPFALHHLIFCLSGHLASVCLHTSPSLSPPANSLGIFASFSHTGVCCSTSADPAAMSVPLHQMYLICEASYLYRDICFDVLVVTQKENYFCVRWLLLHVHPANTHTLTDTHTFTKTDSRRDWFGFPISRNDSSPISFSLCCQKMPPTPPLPIYLCHLFHFSFILICLFFIHLGLFMFPSPFPV